MLTTPRHRARLAAVAVAAYGLRPASYWLLLERTGPDRFPYDRHGYGLLGDIVLPGALAVPLAALLRWIMRRYHAGQGVLAPASTRAWTMVSFMLLLLLGAPPPAHWGAMDRLPVADTWPVLATDLLWFAVGALLRAAAVAPPPGRG